MPQGRGGLEYHPIVGLWFCPFWFATKPRLEAIQATRAPMSMAGKACFDRSDLGRIDLECEMTPLAKALPGLQWVMSP